jgi:hypothetical protein
MVIQRMGMGPGAVIQWYMSLSRIRSKRFTDPRRLLPQKCVYGTK